MKKVKISYTTDFNEVPIEVSEILQKSLDINEEVNVFIKSAQRKVLSEEINSSFNDVNSARESLVKSTIVLEDVLEILQGYGSVIQQLLEEPEDIEIGATTPPVDVATEGNKEGGNQ